MKKVYVKPSFREEKFTLTQNIAENCGVPHEGHAEGQHQFASPDSCYWKSKYYPNEKLFYDGNGVCNLDGEEFGVCYNEPAGGLPVFGS